MVIHELEIGSSDFQIFVNSCLNFFKKFDIHFSNSFHPYPLFQWYPQSNDILLNLSMKCSNSAFNARGSRLMIVVVQLEAEKIYVAAAEALRKKERQDEPQFTTKTDGFLSFIPP
jgi:hypothetical protein